MACRGSLPFRQNADQLQLGAQQGYFSITRIQFFVQLCNVPT